MRLWMRVLPVLLLLGSSLVAFSAPLPGLFSNELDTDRYDCRLLLLPGEKLTTDSNVSLTLESGAAGDATRLTINKQTITIASLHAGQATPQAQGESGVVPGTAYRLTVLRRGAWLGVLHDDALLLHADMPRPAGTAAGIIADAGWSVQESTVERLDPVCFADDFMRTADEAGQWTWRSGLWKLSSAWDSDAQGNQHRFSNATYAQNPFAWMGCAATTPFALCTAGNARWDDYTFSVAVRPAISGAVGVVVNMPDANTGLLVRWSAANDRGAGGDALSIARLEAGHLTPLASDPGGFIPGQWYKLSVVSTMTGLQVLVDGHQRLSLPNVTPFRGGVGLYTEGTEGMEFDDVTVYGHSLLKDLISERQAVRVNQRFQDDAQNSMREWASLQDEWQRYPGNPSLNLHRLDFFGDQWMVLSVTPFKSAGKLTLVLHNDGKNSNSGYRAVMQVTAKPPTMVATLWHDGTQLARKDCTPFTASTEYTIRFLHLGNRLALEIDGQPVLELTDVPAASGLRPAYAAEGCFALVHDVAVLGRNVLDYTFTEAPVDWVGEGAWMPTIRWSCSPKWSFLGGWNRGNAVLWHKQRFSGDQLFEAFVGPKMNYPRQREKYESHFRDFAITICGDGRNPRTGYSGIYGAPDLAGHPNQRSVLLRNGVEVGSVNLAVPGKDTAHNAWFHLELHKTGDTVAFWVNGAMVLSYQDPQPIAEGQPAIWTVDSGISIARARVHFASPPHAPAAQRVILDAPEYPEFSTVGTPLVLDFPHTWSTTGKPVQLRVVPRTVPAGDEKAVVIDGKRTTFTPRKPGDHWYEIQATDGTQQSWSYHLSLPVFDASRGRDDARALVLYRFDEGKGRTIRDRSAITPALDLSIPTDPGIQWLPGRGLTLHGSTPVMSKNAADKLLSIAKTQEFTIEMWMSNDTISPPDEWTGCLLTWEMSQQQRNFAIGQSWYVLLIAPRNVWLAPGSVSAFRVNEGFQLGLHHMVVTLQKQTIRCYLDGVLLQEQQRPQNLQPETFRAGLPLLLGNEPDGQRTFLGTYYLVAIHDRCLPAEAVLRHYQVGPSAK